MNGNNQTQAELARAAKSLADALSASGSTISTNARSVSIAVQDIQDSLKDEQIVRAESVQAHAKWNTAINKQRVADIEALQEGIAMRKEAINKERKVSDSAEKQIKRHLKRIKELNQRLEEVESKKAEIGEEAAESEKKQLEQEKNTASQQLKEARRAHNSSVAEQRKYAKQIGIISAEVISKHAELEAISIRDIGSALKTKAAESAVSFMRAAFDPSKLGTGLKGMVEDLRYSMATGSDFIHDNFDRLAKVTKLQLSVEDYMQMNAQYRQLILSVGGADAQLKMLEESTKNLSGVFAVPADAAKYAQQQMSILAKSGITPTTEAITSMSEEMKAMRSLTGMTGESFNELIGEMVEDSDIRSQLRTMDQRQRIEMIRGLAVRAKENAAIGISIEQTRAMTKTMASLDKETYKERNARAARIQGLTGAMGLGNLGAQMADVIRKAPAIRTEADRDILQRGLTEISNRISAARGSGNVGLEMQYDSLLSALGQEDLVGKDSVFNTNLSEGLRIAEDSNKALDIVAQTQPEVRDSIKEASNITATLLTAANSRLGMIILGIGGIAAQIGLGKLGRNVASKTAGKIFGRGGRGGRGGGGSSGGGRGGGGSGHTRAPTQGRIGIPSTTSTPIIPSGSVSGTANKGINKVAGGAAKAAPKIAGSAARSLLKKIPLIGIGAGLWGAGSRALAGDWTGAGMEIMSGAASTVPGLGTAVSLGIDAALMAKDVGAFNNRTPDSSIPNMSNTATPTQVVGQTFKTPDSSISAAPTQAVGQKVKTPGLTDIVVPKETDQERQVRENTKQLLESLNKAGDESNEHLTRIVPLAQTGNELINKMLQEVIMSNKHLLELIELMKLTEGDKVEMSQQRAMTPFGGKSVLSYTGIR